AYHTHSLAPPNGAAIDDNITTEPPLPPCLVDMRLTQERRHSSAQKVSRSSTSRMVAELTSSSRELSPMIPELCTKCVIGPRTSEVAANTCSMSSSSAMSPCTAIALPPAFFTAATTPAAAFELVL